MQGLGQTDFLKKFQGLNSQIQTYGFLYVHHEKPPGYYQKQGFQAKRAWIWTLWGKTDHALSI